jgi:hypothetical protein
MKTDITKIVERNFERAYADIFLEGFIKKGKLVTFTNLSQKKEGLLL